MDNLGTTGEQAAKEAPAAPAAPVENGAAPAENGNGASVQALPPAWPVQLS